MKIQLKRTFKDGSIKTDTLPFAEFKDATEHARKWITADDNIQSVVVQNGEFKLTYERPND